MAGAGQHIDDVDREATDVRALRADRKRGRLSRPELRRASGVCGGGRGCGLRASRPMGWLMAAMSLTLLLLRGSAAHSRPRPAATGTLHGDGIRTTAGICTEAVSRPLEPALQALAALAVREPVKR
ncbi:hypothetical protein [Streptomyces sp. NPDC058964]|uniref:hypothetical protein n=1 Tax=Streptomyces sp. NPDC058964 TaxID=3346681 RepID=UPI00369F4CCD